VNPRVKEVIPLLNYQLQLIFTNEEKKIYDCSPLLDFAIFQELKNKQYFNQVKILDGMVTWPNEQDICPDTLYLDSISQT
jgi:hypothetical protein